MLRTTRLLFCSVAALLASTAVQASAAISFTGSPYTQNFDSFAGSAASLPFSNNDSPNTSGGLAGLYLYLSGNQFSTTTAATDAVQGVPDYISRNSGTTNSSTNSVTYRGSGAVLTSAHYYYRPSAAATDVALGFFNTDTNSRGLTPPSQGYLSAGFGFINDTADTITGFQFRYVAEGSTATLNITNTDVISVSYAIGATGVGDGDGTWINVPGMGYSVTALAVVTQPSVDTVSGINWTPGSTLFVRFRDANVGGIDRLSWVDEISFVPEPTAFAAFSLAMIAALRRR